jgi:hydrogenase expression/formation protein HypC
MLIAGVGNIFLGDDGFGGEVVRRLGSAVLPDWVTVADYGTSGMHLAYDLASGYDTTILRRSGHMCLGIPGEVIEFLPGQPDLARVDVSGVRRVINVGLLVDDMPAPGEWVLIHVGFALSKIDEGEAAAALEFLEGIGRAYEEELAALQESHIE